MRKNSAPIRTILPDSKFNDVRVAKLINMIMYDGKKGIAQSIVYDAFDKVQEKTKKGAMEVFEEALKNIGPSIELKVKRVAGSNYQVPTEVNTQRKVVLALRWLIEYSRLRNEKEMVNKLAGEIIDASNNVGAAVKKKEDTHKMAEANKAFAHLRF